MKNKKLYIGDILKNIRKQNNLTQDELAKILGYSSRSTINKIEENINSISYSKLIKLCELYSIDLNQLLNKKNNPNISKAGLNKDAIYPNPSLQSICYIKNTVKNPNIIVGDYTYYSSTGTDAKTVQDPREFEKHVTHMYSMNQTGKLIIGKFCQIGNGAEFIMNGANHLMKGYTTYPFYIFSKDLLKNHTPKAESFPFKGDTVIGNDVWIGQNAVILPGVHIGNGAIIGANAIVARDIPDYAIAIGNPARVIKYRFDKTTINKLLKLKWWDWDIEKIKAHMDELMLGKYPLK